jgi:hypothetical protein
MNESGVPYMKINGQRMVKQSSRLKLHNIVANSFERIKSVVTFQRPKSVSLVVTRVIVWHFDTWRCKKFFVQWHLAFNLIIASDMFDTCQVVKQWLVALLKNIFGMSMD